MAGGQNYGPFGMAMQPQGASPLPPGQASDGGVIGGTPPLPKFGAMPAANSWRSTLAGGMGVMPFGSKNALMPPGMQARPWTLNASQLPGMQAQVAAANPAPAPTPATPAPAPTAPVAPAVPTQSAVSPTLGSAIDPSVMAGLSAEERSHYDIDPMSGTWIRVR